MKEFTILKANEDDLPTILDVQKKAFLEVVKKFNLKSLPALEQSLESLTIDFSKGMILKVAIGNTIVGSVRAYKNNDTCHIERLVVLPEYQNRGIGKALMNEIETRHTNIIRRYELFTGSRDSRNLHFYDQLGYKSYKTEKLNDEVTFVFMEKSV
ncbi:MAG: GNAT family N-acetyltransferase [Smithellaceae bacterium]|nr:GNAT family N-acetyltransferase [Smithellaceae bacterium]